MTAFTQKKSQFSVTKSRQGDSWVVWALVRAHPFERAEWIEVREFESKSEADKFVTITQEHTA